MYSINPLAAALGFALALGSVANPPSVAGAETDGASDDPQSIADLAPAAIPDNENAAAQIEALAGQLQLWDANNAQFYRTPLGMAYDDPEDSGTPPTAEQAAAIRAILDQHVELDDGLHRAAACEQYASRADFTLASGPFIADMLPRIQRFRSIARFVAWRIRLLTHDGQHDEAVLRGIELLHLARLHQQEPTLVGYLVTLAVRRIAARELYDALARGNVSFKTHAALDAELALVDDPQTLTRVLRTERAYALTVEAENAGPLGIKLPGIGVGNGAGKYLTVLIAASEGPWNEFRRGVKKGGKWMPPTGFGVLADNLTPAVEAATLANGRDLVEVRSLRAFNALRLFAKLNKREATGLDEVDLPAEALVDPFSEKPLIARLTDDGWLIYSVMDNERDDGGDFRDMLDYGATPPGDRRAQ